MFALLHALTLSLRYIQNLLTYFRVIVLKIYFGRDVIRFSDWDELFLFDGRIFICVCMINYCNKKIFLNPFQHGKKSAIDVTVDLSRICGYTFLWKIQTIFSRIGPCRNVIRKFEKDPIFGVRIPLSIEIISRRRVANWFLNIRRPIFMQHLRPLSRMQLKNRAESALLHAYTGETLLKGDEFCVCYRRTNRQLTLIG